jgi:hypothetical protein
MHEHHDYDVSYDMQMTTVPDVTVTPSSHCDFVKGVVRARSQSHLPLQICSRIT